MASQFDSVMDMSRRSKKPGTRPGTEVDTIAQLIPSQFGRAMDTAGM